MLNKQKKKLLKFALNKKKYLGKWKNLDTIIIITKRW